jgi:uncharacterized protein YbaP (TraB family)
MNLPVRKVLCLALCVVLCASSVVLAQGQPVAEAAAGDQGLLWKVSSPTGTVYLFGSIHLATEEMYPLPEKVETAFDGAGQLVVEVNAGPEQQAELGQMMMSKGSYPPEESLTDHISDETHAQLTRYLEGAGLPAAPFNRFEPWLIALTVSVLELQKLGLDPTLGIDQHFIAKAKDSKPILELETAEEQLSLFDGLPAELQQLMLKKTLLEIDRMAEDMEEMIGAWTRGDTAAMEALMYKSMKEAPELAPFFKKLFTDRNLTMADKIAAFLDTDSTYFVLVGAGHLVGDDGIVALLKGKEFSVERQ